MTATPSDNSRMQTPSDPAVRYNYVRLTADGAEDFSHLILPDVYEDYVKLTASERQSVYAIGVLDGANVPVAAAVASLDVDDVVSVMSLFVDAAHRRRGIGRELILRLASLASEDLDESDDLTGSEDTDAVSEVIIHIDYQRETRDESLPAFLTGMGFTLLEGEHPAYVIDGEVFKDAPSASVPTDGAVRCVSDILRDDADAWADILDMTDPDLEPDYSFFYGDETAPTASVVVRYGLENDFTVTSTVTADCTEEIYKAVLGAAVRAIGLDNEPFSVVADTEHNAFASLWQELADRCGYAVACGVAEAKFLFRA